MINLRNISAVFVFILTITNSEKSFSQESKFKLIQDKNFEKLLHEKKNSNNSFSVYKNYSLQLFFGTKEGTELAYKDFKSKYPNIDATIIYTNPKYKLIVGNYKNKIEAENFSQKIKNEYPNSLVVKLNK